MTKDLKYIVCLFRYEGMTHPEHYRIIVQDSVNNVEKQLKEQMGGHKILQKKFFEVDRKTGSFEEF